MTDSPWKYQYPLSLDQFPTEKSVFRKFQLTDETVQLKINEAARLRGYLSPKQFQSEAAIGVLKGMDVKIMAPTAGGKSFAFQAPVLVARTCNPKAVGIVISPLNSLMKDQIASLEKNDIPAIFLGQSKVDKSTARRICNGVYAFVYTSPETAISVEMYRQIWMNESFKDNLVAIVVDECHTVEDYGGASFRPQYKQLDQLRSYSLQTPIIAVSATLSAKVNESVSAVLRMFPENTLSISNSVNRRNIFYSILPFRSYDSALKQLISSVKLSDQSSNMQPFDDSLSNDRQLRKFPSRTFVFSPSLSELAEIYRHLQRNLDEMALDRMACLNGSSSRKQVEAFTERLAQNSLDLFVGTSALGMGIDISDVRVVYNLGSPYTFNDYIQQTGRAGRDGKPSVAVLFVKSADYSTGKVSKSKGARVEKYMREFCALVQHFDGKTMEWKKTDTRECIRVWIANYYGEKFVRSKETVWGGCSKHYCCSLCAEQETVCTCDNSEAENGEVSNYYCEWKDDARVDCRLNNKRARNAKSVLQERVREALFLHYRSQADLNPGFLDISILDDNLIDEIAKKAGTIHTESDMIKFYPESDRFREYIPRIFPLIQGERQSFEEDKRKKKLFNKVETEVSLKGAKEQTHNASKLPNRIPTPVDIALPKKSSVGSTSQPMIRPPLSEISINSYYQISSIFAQRTQTPLPQASNLHSPRYSSPLSQGMIPRAFVSSSLASPWTFNASVASPRIDQLLREARMLPRPPTEDEIILTTKFT